MSVLKHSSQMTTQLFYSTGYENMLYTMIFVPILIVLFCLLVPLLVVLSRKRCVCV